MSHYRRICAASVQKTMGSAERFRCIRCFNPFVTRIKLSLKQGLYASLQLMKMRPKTYKPNGVEMMKAKSLVPALVVLIASSVASFAQTPTLLKQHRDWASYALTAGGGKVCYALTKPLTKLPAERNHGDVFFFVTTRPSESVDSEPSLVVGYPFKDKSSVAVDIDGKGFVMFTNSTGAWIDNAATETQLVSAMKAGREMTVNGESERGTRTSYKFSLSGVTAAINTANAACR